MFCESEKSELRLAYASLFLAISSSATILIPPLALSLGVCGLVLSWHLKLATIPDSKTRKIVNAALVISIAVLVILFLGAMGLIVTRSDVKVVEEMF